MKPSFFSLTLIAVFAVSAVFSQLSILSPPQLNAWWQEHPEATKTSIAAFGYVPWGRKIMGTLKYANPRDGCDYVHQSDADYLEHQILVVERGNCAFVVKAHYAQLAGAKMLLIADNTYESVNDQLMVDSMGQGQSVTIPVVLMDKVGGDKLLRSLNSTDPEISTITAVFDFVMKKVDEVQYNMWLSSASPITYSFMSEWRALDKKLGSYAKMQPHYAHFFATGKEAQLASSSDCICGGRYCAPDPDDERGNSGRDVLLEDLRQMCIKRDYGIETWYNYLENYDSFCLTSGNMEECAKHTMSQLGLEQAGIDQCVKYSFDKPDYNKCTGNTFFDIEEDLMVKEGIITFPSVSINGIAFRGNIVPPKGVFEAICESFNEMPGVCRHYMHIPPPKRNNVGMVFACLIFVGLFGFFACICYRRYLKREMYKQMVRDVNVAVSQYIAFKDETESEMRGNTSTMIKSQREKDTVRAELVGVLSEPDEEKDERKEFRLTTDV